MILRMFGRRFLSGRSQRGRGLHLLLSVFVLFALWHVSQHDLPTPMSAGNGGHCSICRLNHMPSAGGTAQVVFAAIFLRAVPLVAVDVPYFRSKSYLPRLARGPPPF